MKKSFQDSTEKASEQPEIFEAYGISKLCNTPLNSLKSRNARIIGLNGSMQILPCCFRAVKTSQAPQDK